MHFRLYSLFIICMLCMSIKLSAQNQVLFNYFNITSEGADVLLEWELKSEDGIQEFEIYRKFNEEASFEYLETMDLNGTQKYQFLDDEIFKTASRTIHYELHIVTENGTQTFIKSLLHSPTSIQRTWGSIKSMFR